jgi:UDP-glucose 4-epimerase
MAPMTIAVIGGTGFIGRHLLERLAVVTHDRFRVLVHSETPAWLGALTSVDAVPGDLLRPDTLAPLFEGTAVVINLAGQVSGDVDGYQGVNLRGMVCLAQACLTHHVRRVIHASSALVYGNVLDATEDSPCRPISPYATMKLAAEEILTSLLAGQVELLSVRLSNVYGPRQSKGLMPYLVRRILHREPIVIDADGAQIRDFIHVQDVVSAFVKAVGLRGCTGPINIGSGRATSIMNLVRLLEEVLEAPATGQYRPEHSGGERRNTVNVARAQEVLGWQATIELAHGTRTLLSATEAGVQEGLCV